MEYLRTTTGDSWAGLTSPFATIAVGLVLFIISPSLWAADVVELSFQSSSPDTSFEDLLYLTVGVELSQAGLSSSRSGGPGTYLLEANYATSESSVHLVLKLSKHISQQLLASEEADLPLDDTFETLVGKMMRDLLAKGLGQTASVAAVDTTIGGLLPEPKARSIPTTVSWRADAVFGGTAIFGDLAKVGHNGLETALSSGLFWLADTWSLKVGARAGTIRLLNNKGVTGGPLYMSSAAVGADWGTGRQLPFRLMIGGSVGTLILTVAEGQKKSKAVPWVDGDTVAEFPVGAGFFVGTELRLQAAFEKILIWGLSPALTVGKEF